MKALIPAILIIGVAVLFLAVRILLIKGGNFSKRCSSAETGDDKKSTCGCSGGGEVNEKACKNYSLHHPNGIEEQGN